MCDSWSSITPGQIQIHLNIEPLPSLARPSVPAGKRLTGHFERSVVSCVLIKTEMREAASLSPWRWSGCQ